MIWKTMLAGLCVPALYVLYVEMKIRSDKRISDQHAEAERRERARRKVNEETEAKQRRAVRRAYLHD